jgi:tRNA pseudouridine55 synthase
MKDGILAINKPQGISSARVVARVKRVLGVKKIGHTGTLDPFATGLLLIAVQKATRISRFFLSGTKKYTATVTLGIETDTYDCTGKVVFEAQKSLVDEITAEDVHGVVAQFQGPQKQIPPSFSALKHKGQPLYKLARKGEMIQKPPRDIEIYSIYAQKMDLPQFEMDVHCTGGTYIRSLAYDIGKKLGCGAHLSGLIRTKSSAFELENAIGLEALEDMEPSAIEPYILPMSDCLSFLPSATVDNILEKKISYGQKLVKKEVEPLLSDGFDPASIIKIVNSSNQLLALIEPSHEGDLYNYCCVFAG